MALALQLLAQGCELEVLLDGEDRFIDLPQVMSRLALAAGSTLCHRIRY